MDVEDLIWLGALVIICGGFGLLLAYAVFVSAPDHANRISLCEQAGGVAITDDGRYRLCLSADAVIKLEDIDRAD